MIPRITAEYAAGRHDWDVLHQFQLATVGIPLKNGYITDYRSSQFAQYPPSLTDTAGRFVMIYGTPYGLVYNRNRVSAQELAKLNWLTVATDPAWKGRIGVREGTTEAGSGTLAGVYLLLNKDKAAFTQ